MKKQVGKGKKAEDLTEADWIRSNRKLSLAPVAVRLQELLGMPVAMAADVVGPDAQAKAAALRPGELLLLENTRFEKGETKNDPAFAKALAELIPDDKLSADYIIPDALDPRVGPAVAKAVAQAARDSGVARI